MNEKQCNNVNSIVFIERKFNKVVVIFYGHQMNQQCKKDEKIIKAIISNNVKTKDSNSIMKIIIYYHNCNVKKLIVINKITRKN